MTFASPAWMLALLALPVLAALGAWLSRRHRARLLTVFAEPLLERILPASVRRRRAARGVLALLGLGAAVVALAEPQFPARIQAFRAEGVDLVVLLDLSRSMDARDVDPSRLGRARREISDLGRVLEGDRVGLVVFAGGAYPRLPLTSDFAAIEMVVGETSTDTFDAQGSDLGAAIEVGTKLLLRAEDDAGKALLVLSDGESHDPERALAAARAAAEAGVPVYAMGIGVEPAEIPLRQGGALVHDGQTVKTTPDFTTLEAVARETGGAFVTSSASTRDTEALYAEMRRTLRAVLRDEQRHATHDSAFQWPLSVGVLAWLLAAFLGDGRRPLG